MESFVLKIFIAFVLTCYNFINFSESVPLRRKPRMSLADWTNYNSFEPEGPGTYGFGYDIEDPEKDNIQFRDEERHPNGTVRGSYGYLRPDGVVHIVHYTADRAGFRANIESYPRRGQLKPFGNPKLSPEDSTPSPALTAALQSQTTYKKQHVHEQHLRPIDANPDPEPDIQLPSYTFADNTKEVYRKHPVDALNLKDVFRQYTNPYRSYIKRN
ncbi:hypothetical protein NQ315_008020 [Exocentrus adspersus]|uniref:Uncharacterized protein n=1 Tax=Exocentrus adspersus TaxID=1586481 RepID=A0AAV8VW96_9CUCU|nr:hypothetical protein NQ315_008020 [Exocentrus adspersus]